MSLGNLTKIRFPVLVLVLLFVAVCAVQPAAALKVEGDKIMVDVVPGTTYLFPMAISIDPTDSASDYAVDVLGFGQSVTGGSYTPLAAADDTSPYSARTFVTVDSPVIHLAPGQRQAFNATINVPQNVGAGGRYAIIYIHPAATSGGGTTFATAMIVPVMLTIQNSNLIETGTITGLSVGNIVAGQPITVSSTFQNTGNHHYYGVVNQVTVADASGNAVGTAKSNPAAFAMIPGQSVSFDTSFSTPLGVGTYTVKSNMLLGNNTVLASNSTSITVNVAYIPPFQKSSVTVAPGSPATLTVPEGTVTISFPQGSVLADTTVTVSPYIGTLPALPAGATAGSTVFSVDGLNGLLASDATITVKYSQADLTAAGNDASKLVLGRYDSNAWTLLPTTVDKNAMTLTASTNRFSTWAVIAAQSSPGAGAAPAGSAGNSGTGKSGFMGLGLGLDPLLIIGAIGIVIIATGIKRK
jgi:hypothetical protein